MLKGLARSAKALGVVLALFPMSGQADIQPKSGLWQGQGHLLGQSGCPPQMAAQMSQVFASETGYGPQQITFPIPFDPTGLTGDFQWVKIGEDLWRAEFQEVAQSGMGTLVTDMQIDLKVLSETALEQVSSVRVTFPPALAQMLGSSEPCVVTSRVDHQFAGP